MFGVAFRLMHDVGFRAGAGGRPLAEMRKMSRVDRVRLASPGGQVADGRGSVHGGVGIYGFYAAQPYLLELYGDPHAYAIAGLAAAIVAGAQILGGLRAPHPRT